MTCVLKWKGRYAHQLISDGAAGACCKNAGDLRDNGFMNCTLHGRPVAGAISDFDNVAIKR